MPHYTTIRGHTWLSLGTRISLSLILDPSNPTTSKRASVYTYTQRAGPSSYDRGNPTLLPESLSFARSDFNRMDQPTRQAGNACGFKKCNNKKWRNCDHPQQQSPAENTTGTH